MKSLHSSSCRILSLFNCLYYLHLLRGIFFTIKCLKLNVSGFKHDCEFISAIVIKINIIECKVPSLLELMVYVVNFTLRPISPPRISLPVTILEAGWATEPSQCGGEGKAHCLRREQHLLNNSFLLHDQTTFAYRN